MMKATECKNVKLKGQAEKVFEYHIKHYDIFYVTKGYMSIILGDQLTKKDAIEYIEDKDFGEKAKSDFQEIKFLQKGESLIVPPLRLHKPRLVGLKGNLCDFILIKLEDKEIIRK